MIWEEQPTSVIWLKIWTLNGWILMSDIGREARYRLDKGGDERIITLERAEWILSHPEEFLMEEEL